MPKQSKSMIRAKQTRVAEFVAQNPALTIRDANEKLRASGEFKYRLTPHRASPVVRASRAAVQTVRAQIMETLNLGVEISST